MLFIKQFLQGLDDKLSSWFLLRAFQAFHKTQVLQPAGLNFGAGLTVGRTSTTAASWFVVNGIPVKLPASTALPALTGVNLTSGQRVAISYFCDSAGALSMSAGAAVNQNSQLVFPPPPRADLLCIGYLVIEAAATFTGGTTALDAANITSQFISNIDGIPVVQDVYM